MTGPDHPPINRLTDDDPGGERKRNGGSDRTADENLVALRSRKDYIDVSALAGRPWKGKARRADAALEPGKLGVRATDLGQVR